MKKLVFKERYSTIHIDEITDKSDEESVKKYIQVNGYKLIDSETKKYFSTGKNLATNLMLFIKGRIPSFRATTSPK